MYFTFYTQIGYENDENKRKCQSTGKKIVKNNVFM